MDGNSIQSQTKSVRALGANKGVGNPSSENKRAIKTKRQGFPSMKKKGNLSALEETEKRKRKATGEKLG